LGRSVSVCNNCDWQDALENLENMDGSDYDFAEDTLYGIKEWIEQNKHITPGQEDAIANIELAVENKLGI